MVYRLCFKIVLARFRTVTALMEYNAGVMHKFSASESHIEIPKNLLKSKDLSETYTSLTKIKGLLEGLKKEGSQNGKEETRVFEEQKELMKTF